MSENAVLNKHKMLIISTGGTIAGEVASEKKGDDFEIKKAEHFSELIKGVITDYKRRYEIEIVPIPHELYELDSSDIKPEHWQGIANVIYENYDDYASFVVTHGTNTLGYTCAAISFIFPNLGKPVIFTGSQVPIGIPGSDAQLNLENAVRLAALPAVTGYTIRGVMVVFGSHIITGARVKKDTEFDYDAFKSFSSASIGRIGRIIDINYENLNRHLRYQTHQDWRVAKYKKELRYETGFDQNIVSLTEFPGMNPDMLLKLVEGGTRGIIIRAFGAGDLSTSFVDVLKKLKDRKIPVVATTQAPNGRATMQVNEPGQKLLEQKLAIPAYDMSIEAQTAKLMWLLAQMHASKITYEQLCTQMILDLRGEVNIIKE
jgi:L-asparaginase